MTIVVPQTTSATIRVTSRGRCSTGRLLVGEAPAPGIVNEVASAHRTAVGQDVRRDKFRFVMSAAARSALSGLPEYSFFDLEIAEHLTCGHWVGFPRTVSEGDKVYWNAGAGLPAFRPRTGVFVRLADDADVTIMAAHMTRMVVDAIARDQSLFPQAVYFIGLKPGWIFGAPFETWPVDLIREGEWRPESDVNVEEELGAMIRDFFAKTSDGDAG